MLHRDPTSLNLESSGISPSHPSSQLHHFLKIRLQGAWLRFILARICLSCLSQSEISIASQGITRIGFQAFLIVELWYLVSCSVLFRGSMLQLKTNISGVFISWWKFRIQFGVKDRAGEVVELTMGHCWFRKLYLLIVPVHINDWLKYARRGSFVV